MTRERWRQVESHPAYWVSDQGRLRRRQRNGQWRYLRGGVVSGYRLWQLKVGGGMRQVLAHRLVVETFYGSIPADRECDHINHEPLDNRLTNLRVVTHDENIRASRRVVLDPRKVSLIRILYWLGTPLRSIASDLRLPHQTITSVITGQTWSSVPHIIPGVAK